MSGESLDGLKRGLDTSMGKQVCQWLLASTAKWKTSSFRGRVGLNASCLGRLFPLCQAWRFTGGLLGGCCWKLEENGLLPVLLKKGTKLGCWSYCQSHELVSDKENLWRP